MQILLFSTFKIYFKENLISFWMFFRRCDCSNTNRYSKVSISYTFCPLCNSGRFVEATFQTKLNIIPFNTRSRNAIKTNYYFTRKSSTLWLYLLQISQANEYKHSFEFCILLLLTTIMQPQYFLVTTTNGTVVSKLEVAVWFKNNLTKIYLRACFGDFYL